MEKDFDLQMFSPPTPPDGNGGGSSSSDITWSGATEITSATTANKKTYTSTTTDQNALLINTSANVKITNATVTKSGGPTQAGDNYSFYGINSGVMCKGGGNTTISGGTVTTKANGANGIFSYGDGTTVIIKDVTIKTTGDGSGGIMTTGGGVTKASNLTVTTTGQSSAAIRTDRGGGTVSVSGGSYTSSGLGSPAIYSTAKVTVSGATLVSNKSEGICIEGQNSVALTDCTLTANNTSTNGQAQFLDAINIYQSMSGDSSEGTSTFTMTGGVINNKSGHVFHVTNTAAVITLNNVTINNTDSDNVLLSVCDDGWSGASNIATVNVTGQTLSGNILVGDDSTLNLNISDNSTFSGNISGVISNAAGTSISTSVGSVNVTLDSSSKWYLTSNIELDSFSGTAANVITNGYSITVDGATLDGTTDSDDDGTEDNGDDGETDEDQGVTVKGSAVTVDSSFNGDTINLANSKYSGVTKIYASKSTHALYLVGNSKANTITGGTGNDTVYGYAGADSLLGGKGNDKIYGGAGADYIDGGYGADTLVGGNGKDNLRGKYGNDVLLGGDGDDYLSGGRGADSLSGGKGADYLSGDIGNDTLNGGAGNDSLFGGSGADNLYGGTGNDTLNGGDGADLFIYKKSTGNDVIEDYVAGTDKISISGSYTGTVSGSDVVITCGTGTLTIKKAVGKSLTINNKTKTYSALIESEDISVDIDSIIENNLVGEIDSYKSELKQEKLITYAE